MSSPDNSRDIGTLAAGGQPDAPHLLTMPVEQRPPNAFSVDQPATQVPADVAGTVRTGSFFPTVRPAMTTVSSPVRPVAGALNPDFGLRPDGDLAACRTRLAGVPRVRAVEAVLRAALTEVRAGRCGGHAPFTTQQKAASHP